VRGTLSIAWSFRRTCDAVLIELAALRQQPEVKDDPARDATIAEIDQLTGAMEQALKRRRP